MKTAAWTLSGMVFTVALVLLVGGFLFNWPFLWCVIAFGAGGLLAIVSQQR